MTMATKRWKDIKGLNPHMTPARMAAIDARVEKELVEMDLKAIRETLGLTQADVAAQTAMTQPEVSQLERRPDHLLSTLRRYVTALGGELEIIATFGDRRVRLHAAG
jgi:hypothetical protein